ncbi:hypothetical protein ACRTDR_04775 [Shewanella algae]
MKNIIVNLILTTARFFFAMSQIFNSGKRKKKILLYTDSRGTTVESLYKQRNPFFSYLKFLKEFDVVYKFCPHKFTSILDFLDYYDNCDDKFDFIILHCGIVDFAPRPISSYECMLKTKNEYLKRKNWLHYFNNRKDFLCNYEGEKTLQFMSVDFLEKEIIPELTKISGLIYIGINEVLSDWDGNYWRARPACINEQLVQDELMIRNLAISISLRHWDAHDIKKYTVDNVHYNKLGLSYIGIEIKKVLKNFG